ncbi:MAG: hypothetical protein UHK44_07130 [Bacteroidaceae bacterium]|nr:hypothetical protein [Bacteroidaceae bacterium]
MIPSAKKAILKGLRLLFSPIRSYYKKRNGIPTPMPRMEIPNDILLGAARDAIREGNTATIAVKGWSMRPFLEHQRDKVLLDNPQGAKVGDAVLAEILPGNYVLHRIINIIPHLTDDIFDEITLMGDGNIRGTEQCLRKDICGIVTHYVRPNRTIPANDPKLVRRIRLWRKLLPIRRYLLFIYKSII